MWVFLFYFFFQRICSSKEFTWEKVWFQAGHKFSIIKARLLCETIASWFHTTASEVSASVVLVDQRLKAVCLSRTMPAAIRGSLHKQLCAPANVWK